MNLFDCISNKIKGYFLTRKHIVSDKTSPLLTDKKRMIYGVYQVNFPTLGAITANIVTSIWCQGLHFCKGR